MAPAPPGCGDRTGPGDEATKHRESTRGLAVDPRQGRRSNIDRRNLDNEVRNKVAAGGTNFSTFDGKRRGMRGSRRVGNGGPGERGATLN